MAAENETPMRRWATAMMANVNGQSHRSRPLRQSPFMRPHCAKIRAPSYPLEKKIAGITSPGSPQTPIERCVSKAHHIQRVKAYWGGPAPQPPPPNAREKTGRNHLLLTASKVPPLYKPQTIYLRPSQKVQVCGLKKEPEDLLPSAWGVDRGGLQS